MSKRIPWLHDDFTRARLFYLSTLGALGIVWPFINVFYESVHKLSGRQIGILAALPPIATLLISPIWGSLADSLAVRQKQAAEESVHLRILRWVILGAAVCAWIVGQSTTFWTLLISVAVFNMMQSAVMPLGDGMVATVAAKRNVPYGNLRLWGSIGFAISSLAFGQIVSQFDLGLEIMFPAFACVLLLAIPAARKMVPYQAPVKGEEQGKALDLLRDKPLLLFLLIAGLAATGVSTGYVFLYVFLGSLGASSGLMGTVSAVGALVEVPCMLWGSKLIQKRGAPQTFVIGSILLAIGWGLFAVLRNPNLAPFIQIIGGAGMGLFLPSAVVYVAQRAPAGRNSTAQSLLGAVIFGIAPLIASQVAGAIYDTAGPRIVLATAASIMAAGILLFILTRNQNGQA